MKLTTAQLIADYLKRGRTIKRGKYFPPRKEEITFPLIRGTIANMGHKSYSLGTQGYRGSKKT